MVESLFRELSNIMGGRYRTDHTAYDKAQAEHDALEEKLLENRKLKALKKKCNALRYTIDRRKELHQKELNKVRNRYLANGLTPAVLKSLNILLDKVEETMDMK